MTSDYVPQIAGSDLPKRTHTSDHFRILQSIYVIGISFGLRDLADGVISWVSTWDGQRAANILFYLPLFFALSVLALAVRFFFMVEELSRVHLFLIHKRQDPSDIAMTLFHYPVVIVHGWLVYAVCNMFKSLQSQFYNLQGIRWLGTVNGGLLILNAIWLLRVLYVLQNAGDSCKREERWIFNNVLCAMGILALCWPVLSTEPMSTGRVWGVLALSIGNSLADLGLAAEHYVAQD